MISKGLRLYNYKSYNMMEIVLPLNVISINIRKKKLLFPGNLPSKKLIENVLNLHNL